MKGTIEDTIEELSNLHRYRQSLEQTLQQREADAYARLLQLEEVTRAAKDEAVVLRAEIESRQEDISKELQRTDSQLLNLQNKIRMLGRGVSKQKLGQATRFSSVREDVLVSVGKSELLVKYLPEILEEAPELLTATVDGDPVVTYSINPDILDRLVTRGEISAALADKYKRVSHARTPCVSFRLGDQVTVEEDV